MKIIISKNAIASQIERFIDKLDLEPTLIKSHPNYSNLCDYGTIAA